MAGTFAPIPRTVSELVPELASTFDGAFEVRTSAYEDNGKQMFGIDVWSEPNRIIPTDKRKNPYTEARITSWFFEADGRMTPDSPQSYVTRYGRY